MLNRSASLAMSTCVLKALPGKFDIKRHSPSISVCIAPMASTTTTGLITYDHYRMSEGAKFCYWTSSQISKFYWKKKHCIKTGNVSRTNINV